MWKNSMWGCVTSNDGTYGTYIPWEHFPRWLHYCHISIHNTPSVAYTTFMLMSHNGTQQKYYIYNRRPNDDLIIIISSTYWPSFDLSNNETSKTRNHPPPMEEQKQWYMTGDNTRWMLWLEQVMGLHSSSVFKGVSCCRRQHLYWGFTRFVDLQQTYGLGLQKNGCISSKHLWTQQPIW